MPVISLMPAFQGNTQCVELLLQLKADVHAVNNQGSEWYMHACSVVCVYYGPDVTSHICIYLSICMPTPAYIFVSNL